jgi:hypothetical protein
MKPDRSVEKFDRPARIDPPLGTSTEDTSGQGEGTEASTASDQQAFEQAWKDQIARLADPNTPLTEVMATLRQAELWGGLDENLQAELDAIATARLEQAWKDQIATGGGSATTQPWTGSSSSTSPTQGDTPVGADTGILSPTSEPSGGTGWQAPSIGGWPDWGSSSGSSGAGSPSAGGDEPGSSPPDLVDAGGEVTTEGGDDRDLPPPDNVDAGGATSRSTSGSQSKQPPSSSSGGPTVLTADDEAEFVEIRPGTLGYIWVQNEDGSYTAYDPNTGAAVEESASDEGDEEDDEEEEEETEDENGSGESLTEEADSGPTSAALRERLGTIDDGSVRSPLPGYVDPVDPDLALASDSGGLSVVRPGDAHVNPDLISLYGPDGAADGGVTVSASGTPPVLGSAPMDPPKPMPGGEDSVSGPLTPGTGWGGGGGFDPTVAGGNDDDLDDLEVQRLTGGGPSTPTQSLASEPLASSIFGGSEVTSPELAGSGGLAPFDASLAAPAPLAPEGPAPDLDEGSLSGPDEAAGPLGG